MLGESWLTTGNPGALAGIEGVHVFEMDVTDPASVALAAKRVAHDVGAGGLAAVVNNAGVIVQGPLELVPIGASKAALESLSAALRTELAVWRVPVVMVQPGTTNTLIFAKAEAAARTALQDTDPAKVELYQRHLAAVEKASANQRSGPPEKVAATIVKAVEARRPKRWYAASADVRMMRLVSRLPAGLREALVARTAQLRDHVPSRSLRDREGT